MDGWQVIADEHGLFHARDARAAGLVGRDLAHLTRTEQVVRLCRGWYTLPPGQLPADQDSPAERRRQLHGLVTSAMIREFAGRAVASNHSALVLASLPIFAADLRQVHVTRARDDLSRKRRGLSIHEQVGGAKSEAGVIEPAVAIVQTGVINGPLAGLVAADAALHRQIITPADLARAMTLVDGPGVGQARRILVHVDARSESPGETRVRHALAMMGLTSSPQFTVRDGDFVAMVDLLLDVAPVVVEFDGFVKYGRTVIRPGVSAPGDIVFAEKVREDRLRTLGYEVVRIIWSELDDLPALRRRIEAAIQRARGRRAA